MADKIVISEEEIENVSNTLTNSYTNLSDAGEHINPDFSGAVRAGLLGGSVNEINKQVDSITHSVGVVHNLMNQYTEKMINFDSLMAEKIDAIDIPQDYLVNDAAKENTYTQTMVAKLDGESVNDGQTAKEFNDIDESTIKQNNLENINENVTVEQNFDDSSSINVQEGLASMNSQSGNKEEYDASSSISSEVGLSNMDNNNYNEEVQYDDNVNIQEQKVSEMDDKKILEQRDEGSKIVDETIVGNNTIDEEIFPFFEYNDLDNQ